MTTLTTNTSPHRLDSFFAAVGRGFSAYFERRSRMDEIRRLDAKTDEELARMGLRREMIAHHVFRDLLAF